MRGKLLGRKEGLLSGVLCGTSLTNTESNDPNSEVFAIEDSI